MNETQPLKRHLHADLILEFARQKSSGELDAGWWCWYLKERTENWCAISSPSFAVHYDYKFEKTDKHPDNQKFVKWEDLPFGTLVRICKDDDQTYRLIGASGTMLMVAANVGCAPFTAHKDNCKLAKEQPWIGEAGLISKLSGCVCQLVETDRVGYIEEVTDRTHTKFYISKFKITGLQTGYTLV